MEQNKLPTFWDVAKAFKWAAEYRDEIGGELLLSNGQWLLTTEDEDGNENEDKALTPGNVAELFCLQCGFEKEAGIADYAALRAKADKMEQALKAIEDSDYPITQKELEDWLLFAKRTAREAIPWYKKDGVVYIDGVNAALEQEGEKRPANEAPSTTIEFCYRHPDGRVEVRYRRIEGTPECDAMIKEVAALIEKVKPLVSPYFYRKEGEKEPVPQQVAVIGMGDIIRFAEWAAEFAFFDDGTRLWEFYEEEKRIEGQFRFSTKEFFELFKKQEGRENEISRPTCQLPTGCIDWGTCEKNNGCKGKEVDHE